MKKGFTIIELVVTLNILIIILFSMSFPIKSIININRENDTENHLVQLDNLISFSRMYCKSKKVTGSLIFLSGMNLCVFNVNYNPVKRCSLGKNLKFDSFEGYSIEDFGDGCRVYVNEKGNIQAMSIKLKDVNGSKYKIAVRVGNCDEEIYKE